MPQMYRPGGVRKFFRSFEEGQAAGFYPSFNEMAKAQRQPEKAPVAVKEDPVKATEPTREEILAIAKDHGLDTSIHHMKLRKQVEELIDAEVGAGESSVQPTEDIGDNDPGDS